MAKLTYTNLNAFINRDFARTLTYKVNGVAQDITDFTFYFTIKEDLADSDSDAIYSDTITVHSDPIHGITQIAIPRADTIYIKPGKYVYDVSFLDANTDTAKTILRGDFTFEMPTDKEI